MDNATIIARLQALGPLPDACTPASDTFPFLLFDELVQQLRAPLSQEHAVAIINLGPPPDTGSLGIEWALIHAVDLLSAEALQQAVTMADDTEVKRTVEVRLANYFKGQSAQQASP
jgi:hypothetical protein